MKNKQMKKLLLILIPIILIGGIIVSGVYYYKTKKQVQPTIKNQQENQVQEEATNETNNIESTDNNQDNVVSGNQEKLPAGWSRHFFNDWNIKFSLAYPDYITMEADHSTDAYGNALDYIYLKNDKQTLLRFVIPNYSSEYLQSFSENSIIGGISVNEGVARIGMDGGTPSECHISFLRNNMVLEFEYWGVFNYDYNDTNHLCDTTDNSSSIERQIINTIKIY